MLGTSVELKGIEFLPQIFPIPIYLQSFDGVNF